MTKIVTETNLVDWDYNGPDAFEPKTAVEVTIEPKKIEVELSGDNALGAIYRRSVLLEMHNDDGLRVLIYGFDQSEPRVFIVGVDGTIEERTH